MRLISIHLLSLILFNIILSSQLWATSDHDHDHRDDKICQQALESTKGEIVVRHDGLSKEYAEQALKDAIAARDVLNKLGVPTPPHQIIIAPERQLNILAATGVLPAPHAISGAQIFNALKTGSTMGVLEFAQPGGAPASHGGCSTCRSYYSNMTSLRDQRPIYLHVGGHNHVFQRSFLSRLRNVDPIAASDLLAKEMEAQYQGRGYEEVSLFYHYLHAMNELQDFVDGTFTDPSQLTPKASEAVLVAAPQNNVGNWSFTQEEKKVKQVPWQLTPSVLQFMSANLPNHIPDFKRELIKRYEQTVRVYPAVVQQKFVHEGWATFLMMLGQKHSEWNSSRDYIDFAEIVSGAAGGALNVTQPYSFGLHGYHHLYMKFMRKPELKGLSELAKDVLFVKYVDEMLPTMTDSDFVVRVVDEEFVNRHHLVLARKGTEAELMKHWEAMVAAGVPQEKLPKGVVISKSAERIRRAINRRVGFKNSPLMQAVNPALANPFQINMQQRVIENAPLEPQSAAQVFFAQTQVTETPVSAIFLLSERWINPDVEKPKTIPVRMEVRPDGRVRLFKRNTMDTLAPNPEETELTELAAQLQLGVEYYKTDQSFSFSDKVLAEDQKRWEQMFPKMIDEEVAKANVQGLTGISDYAPTAARAIILFSQLIKARFAKQMEAAFQGKLKLKFGPNGVKLPLIPMTPHLQYDQEHVQKANGAVPPAPIDTIDRRIANLTSLAADADDGSLLGPAPGTSVGDPIKVPEGGQGGGSGNQPGDGDGENEINIPPNLYRQMLAKHFEIPNPRLTDGETELPKELPMGERRDSSEEPMWEKMAADALTKAIIARRAKGETAIVGKVPFSQLIREGFGMLDEEDYIIRSRREIMVPSFDAVVVVNIDTSASMNDHRLSLVRNLTYNIRELFRAVYPNVKFHYVALSSTAKEYPEDKIWNVKMNGGTAYAPAMVETKKILANYPLARWNHYVLFAGDSELGDIDGFMKEFIAIRKTLQFFGLIVTRDPGDPPDTDSGGLRATLQASKAEWKWVGISQVNEESGIFKGLNDLFPKRAR